MELTALPGHTGKAGGDGGLEAGMVIADDGFDAMEAAILETFQKLAPVDLGFGELAGKAQHRAFALIVDADGDEHGAALHDAILADFFVAGIDNEIRNAAEGALAPLLEDAIQFGRRAADLSAGNFQAAHLFE